MSRLALRLERIEVLLETFFGRFPGINRAADDRLRLTRGARHGSARPKKLLVRCVYIANRLNSLFVVGLLQGTTQDEPVAATAQQRIVDALRLVAAEADKKNVQFVIEPVNHLQVGFNNSVEEVRALIRAVGLPSIKPMVDTIHMNIEEHSVTQPILDCGHELAHVHLCESNGAKFGTGHIDFAAVIQALDQIGYTGFASVKVYRRLSVEDGAKSSFEYLQSVRSPGILQ